MLVGFGQEEKIGGLLCVQAITDLQDLVAAVFRNDQSVGQALWKSTLTDVVAGSAVNVALAAICCWTDAGTKAVSVMSNVADGARPVHLLWGGCEQSLKCGMDGHMGRGAGSGVVS